MFGLPPLQLLAFHTFRRWECTVTCTMDRPAVYRKGHGAAAAAQAQGDPSAETDMDYLDIPAFLRRQAD